MKERDPWQGMRTVFHFNLPLYTLAGTLLLAGCCGIYLADAWWLKIACTILASGCAYFVIVSLGVSHLVYDRSDLYRWGWCQRAFAGKLPRKIVVCHSGFDEVSEALRQKLEPEELKVLDHYDEARMTEPSIRKARLLFPPTPRTLPAAFDRWPVEDASVDAVFGLLAIHEFRDADERSLWFAEAGRVLRPGGRIVLAEHLRDPANFLAFGPGFLHFHSAADWRRCWTKAGLRATDEFAVTPWVRFFVITPP